MISQSLYHHCCKYVNSSDTPTPDELQSFLRPYVLIIHQPSGRGFYLDRDYRHIIDIDRCQEPENPVEVSRHHLCACSNMPCWAIAMSTLQQVNEFDTFWLY